jgi:glutamate racemase
LFVPLVENNFIDENDKILKLVIKRYLSDFKLPGIDTLILGCTHFPIIKKALSNFFGTNIVLVNSGAETAKFVKEELFKLNLQNKSARSGIQKYFVSDDVENFSAISSLFLKKNIDKNSIKLI